MTLIFIGANTPKILDYSVAIIIKYPNNYKELNQIIKDGLRYRLGQSILIHEYKTRTTKENPLIHKMMRHTQGKTRKELEAFANAA